MKRYVKKCKHGKRKARCKECGGSAICKHGKRKARCKECGGSAICKHGKRKAQCKECGGSEICKHGKRKARCKECGGSAICKHGKRKAQCKECGGSAICKHGKHKAHCGECSNCTCDLPQCTQPNGHRFAGARVLLRHMRRVHAGNPRARTKQKELHVLMALEAAGLAPEYQLHVPFAACGLNSETSCAYVDVVLYREWGAICLEVDENQHASYDPSCDVRRDFDIAAALWLAAPEQRVAVVRFNPDAYRIGASHGGATREQRHAGLVGFLQELAPEQPFSRHFLYYDADTLDAEVPALATHWSSEVQAMSRRVC